MSNRRIELRITKVDSSYKDVGETESLSVFTEDSLVEFNKKTVVDQVKRLVEHMDIPEAK